ncbi:putative neural-cadherin 2 isoform X2 [Diaphorina citri]|nr:putative neural-cadherin 2 isoform X2 [Diaphorina citri]
MVDPLKVLWVLTNSSYLVTKFIRIGIADKNDNPPYFDKALYEAEVDENEDIQHTVLTVTAKDHDECKSLFKFYPFLCGLYIILYTYTYFPSYSGSNFQRLMFLN